MDDLVNLEIEPPVDLRNHVVARELIALSEKKNREFINLNIGQITNVLFEGGHKDGLISGFTTNYIRVDHPWQSELAGQIRKVALTGFSETGRIKIKLIE